MEEVKLFSHIWQDHLCRKTSRIHKKRELMSLRRSECKHLHLCILALNSRRQMKNNAICSSTKVWGYIFTNKCRSCRLKTTKPEINYTQNDNVLALWVCKTAQGFPHLYLMCAPGGQLPLLTLWTPQGRACLGPSWTSTLSALVIRVGLDWAPPTGPPLGLERGRFEPLHLWDFWLSNMNSLTFPVKMQENSFFPFLVYSRCSKTAPAQWDVSQQTLCEHLGPHVDAAVPPKQMESPLSPDKQPSRGPAPAVRIQHVAPPTPSSPGVMVGVAHGNVPRATQAAMNQ